VRLRSHWRSRSPKPLRGTHAKTAIELACRAADFAFSIGAGGRDTRMGSSFIPRLRWNSRLRRFLPNPPGGRSRVRRLLKMPQGSPAGQPLSSALSRPKLRKQQNVVTGPKFEGHPPLHPFASGTSGRSVLLRVTRDACSLGSGVPTGAVPSQVDCLMGRAPRRPMWP